MKINAARVVTTTLTICTIACLSAPRVEANDASGANGERALQRGIASWYKMGRQTANGERFRPVGMTAAHRTLPLGTWVEVTHERTGRSVTVLINDRGPFNGGGRIIDLSTTAARALGIIGEGVAPVTLSLPRP